MVESFPNRRALNAFVLRRFPHDAPSGNKWPCPTRYIKVKRQKTKQSGAEPRTPLIRHARWRNVCSAAVRNIYGSAPLISRALQISRKAHGEFRARISPFPLALQPQKPLSDIHKHTRPPGWRWVPAMFRLKMTRVVVESILHSEPPSRDSKARGERGCVRGGHALASLIIASSFS